MFDWKCESPILKSSICIQWLKMFFNGQSKCYTLISLDISFFSCFFSAFSVYCVCVCVSQFSFSFISPLKWISASLHLENVSFIEIICADWNVHHCEEFQLSIFFFSLSRSCFRPFPRTLEIIKLNCSSEKREWVASSDAINM